MLRPALGQASNRRTVRTVDLEGDEIVAADTRGPRAVDLRDDAAYATFELDQNIIAHINGSWCTRVRRDDLLTFQVDGTLGSAVAGLRRCHIQPRAATPKPVWNPDIPQPIDFFAGWQEIPDNETYENAFRAQWELFLRHVALGEPFPWDLLAGAKGVQLAEAGLKSWKERRWIDIEPLKV